HTDLMHVVVLSKRTATAWSTAHSSAVSESSPTPTETFLTTTNARSPARPANAAAEAEVCPVEAQITAREPDSSALEISIVIPRSLNEPVGLNPSHLR